jgi:hypothetical protein
MRSIFKSRRLKFLLVGVILLAILAIVALSLRPVDAKTAKIQPDWSRGLRIGSTPWNQPPAVAVADAGKHIHLAWGASRSSGVGVHYLQLNERAARVSEQWLEPLEGTPQSVRVLLDDQARPHVFAMARLPGENNARVLHWLLAADGAPRAAQPVSPAHVDAQSYAVVARQGGFDVFCAAEPESNALGLYVARINADGATTAELRLNDHPAKEVSAQVDQRGIAHVIWGEATAPKTRDVFYAVFPNAPQPVAGTRIAIGVTAPAKIGLDGQRVYALWGEALRGNAYAGAGAGYTNLISFPIGEPQRVEFGSLNIPELGQIEFTPYRGDYNIRLISRATAPPGIQDTRLLFAPAPIAGQRGDLAVAQVAGLGFPGLSDWLGRPLQPEVVDVPPAATQHRLFRLLEYGVQARVLPVLLLLRDGRVIGYQVIGYHDGLSANPVVAADQAGDLYAAWLIGSTWEGFQVYYAATTAAARGQLDAVDATDVLVGVAQTAWKMLAGLALLPFVPVVFAPALIIAVIFTVFGSQSELIYDRQSYVILALGCAAYWLVKEVLLGSVLGDPLIGRELEGWSRTAVVWGLQFGIAAVSALIVWRQIATRRINSALWAILLFCGCDMLLSMLTAGPTLALRG